MRLLVLAIRALGDVVLTTPIYRILRTAYPSGSLDVVVERPYGEVLRGNPNIDAIYEVDRRRDLPRAVSWSAQARLIGLLRRKHYDAVVDLFSGPRSAVMVRLTGAGYRIGEDTRRRGRGWLYTHPIPVKGEEEHLVVQKLRLIRPLLVGDAQGGPLELFVDPGEREDAEARLRAAGASLGVARVCLFPGSGWVNTRWPAERFATLGDLLADRYDADVIILGGERDLAVCEAVASRMRHTPRLVSGLRSLRVTAALISRMDLFVGNNTGPMHMAVALKVPTVAVCGPTNLRKYGPWGDRCLVVSRHLPCSPCPQHEETCRLAGRVRQECMLEVSVEEVLDAANRLIAAAEPVGVGGMR